MTAYGYTRVSTEEQGESGLGLAAQRNAVLASRPGAEVVEEVASGGRADNRPELQALLRRLRRGDELVVARLDRLTRSLLDFAGIVEEARRRGWSLVALDAGFDMTSAAGEAMAGMMAVFAQLERRLISERTRAAFAAKRAAGDPSQASARARSRILELRAQGLAQEAIAAEMEAEGWEPPRRPARRGRRWHRSLVRRVLEAS